MALPKMHRLARKPSCPYCNFHSSSHCAEATVGNAIYMEPIERVEAVPKSRWKLVSSTGHLYCFMTDNGVNHPRDRSARYAAKGLALAYNAIIVTASQPSMLRVPGKWVS